MTKFNAADPLLAQIRPYSRFRIRRYLYALAALLLLFLGYRWFLRDEYDEAEKRAMGYRGEVMSRDFPAKKQPNFVKLDLYVESQCPDTTRFIRNQLKKMWALLGFSGRVELTVVPFGKARCVERGNDFECSCQHGPTECAINQLMNCVIDRLGFPSKYVDSLMCMQGTHSLDEALKCVEQLDVEQMRSCAQGERGRRLLALSGQRTASLNPSLDFVPWIVIDGSRNADALYDLTQNVCQAMDPLPDECVKYLAAI